MFEMFFCLAIPASSKLTNVSTMNSMQPQDGCKVFVSGVAQATRCFNNRTARAVPLREKQVFRFS
jgi:hypothetical protein